MALYAFDGTWQEGKTGDDPTIQNTNVFRLYQAYHRRSNKNDFYVGGVGTRFKKAGRVLGGVFGLGELARLNEAYDRLCENWPTDPIIDIIGFSRGAATSLDFSNLIQKRGIRRPGTDDVIERQPKIRFLGLWDVVAAFGLANLGNEILNIGHHLQLPKANLQYCFQAMALDERRPSFVNTRLRGACEVWFRGVHSDVGGGNGNTPLNDIALRWMMRKGQAVGLPIDDADVPTPDLTSLEPSHSHRLPVQIRIISAIDRCHYTVSPLDGWTNPPTTCPRESTADEKTAVEVGAAGVEILTEEARLRVQAMWAQAEATAKAREMSIEPIEEGLLTLFEARSLLITDDATLQESLQAVQRLVNATIMGARARSLPQVNEFVLGEALFGMPRTFPLTD